PRDDAASSERPCVTTMLISGTTRTTDPPFAATRLAKSSGMFPLSTKTCRPSAGVATRESVGTGLNDRAAGFVATSSLHAAAMREMQRALHNRRSVVTCIDMSNLSRIRERETGRPAQGSGHHSARWQFALEVA